MKEKSFVIHNCHVGFEHDFFYYLHFRLVRSYGLTKVRTSIKIKMNVYKYFLINFSHSKISIHIFFEI